MKKTLLALSVMTLCTSAAIIPAFANEAKLDKKVDFYLNKMDADKDGAVSEDEHEEFAEKMFEDADTNDDDVLSRDELIACKKKEMDEMKAAGITESHSKKSATKSSVKSDMNKAVDDVKKSVKNWDGEADKNDNRPEMKQGESLQNSN